MNTTFLLMAEYGTTDIPLETVAEKYLALGARAAGTKAAKGELPFPAYRPGSQKSPWLVRITDLAAWLDAERAKAAADVAKRRVA
ncbi:pyocin activator PrtN family protein [Endozoicomonas sp. 4G]|uniref:pyocin activator PrtN family protein n=1 Tax=Endozoicomonas sp. 4G TaxID=2872754 RepID=UPI0020785813|nr:pyocin activator PrtN family protein [Endozoicomonas sp. 4G]